MPSAAGDVTLAEQRARYDAMCTAFNPPRPAGMTVEHFTLEGPQGQTIPVRVYDPGPARSDGALLYLHGGGFILGGLDSHDIVTARLAADVPVKVCVVDYRLAPEHRFPAAFDDCLAALRALQTTPHRFGLVSPNIVLAGDSAGANLAVAVSIANRTWGGPPIAGQILFYGAFGAGPDLPSYVEEAEAPLLKASDVGAYQDHYLGADQAPDWRSKPILGPLDGLPPTLMLPVEHDPLRDESYALHQALQEAGTLSRLELGEGLVHGCLRALGTSPATQRMVESAVMEARRRLQGEGGSD